MTNTNAPTPAQKIHNASVMYGFMSVQHIDAIFRFAKVAAKLVVGDVRMSYDTNEIATDYGCIEHALATLSYSDIYGDDELAEAYRLVLS